MVRLGSTWLALAVLVHTGAAHGYVSARGHGAPSAVVRMVAGAVMLATEVVSYIPAVAVNNTDGIIKSTDEIHIAWLPNGIFSAGLSRQLVAQDLDALGNVTNVSAIVPWTKYSKGVLVHFSEQNVSQAPSPVPWIAMVSCDTNGTAGSFSMVDDIFTLARDRGAQASLLYSLTGEGCLINQDYLQNFDKVLDVYATTSLQGARVLESQFQNVGASAYSYNSKMLNDSASIVTALLASDALSVIGNIPSPPVESTSPDPTTSTLASLSPVLSVSTQSSIPSAVGTPTQTLAARHGRRQTVSSAPSSATTVGASYLAAVMASQNTTVGGLLDSTNNGTTTAQPSQNNSGPNTGLAMIILYAITGVVTFMFLVVILSGAIRAIRHPERYGPRAGLRNNGRDPNLPQSRAHGLTRAILDTFPVVKFGRSGGGVTEEDVERSEEDEESGKTLEMGPIHPSVVPIDLDDERDRQRHSSSSSSSSSPRPTTAPFDNLSFSLPSPPLSPSLPPILTIDPADVDHVTTCPICVCEFEEGEDVRILPCDRRHRFHKDCIDPWLLRVSSLCPLCRLDLGAPKEGTPVEAEAEGEDEDAAGEQQIISNLRAMWQERRNTNASASTSSGPGAAAGISRNKFFRYVASRRRARGAGGVPEETGGAGSGTETV